MEMQWPLILFTAFVAWSAGLFGTGSVLATMGKAKKAQMPMLITSVVLLAIGGIAVFFHLEHWERIFNGFGHLSSGITQELIAIVVLVIVMVAFFVMLRKSADGGTVPAVLGIIGAIAAVALVCVAGASYLMPARPAWDSVTQIFSLLGNALVLGPLTAAFIVSLKDVDDEAARVTVAKFATVGAAVNVLTCAIFLAVMAGAGDTLTDVGYYFDPTHPTYGMQDAAVASPFVGESVASAVVAIIGSVAALVLAGLGLRGGAPLKALAGAGVVCGVVGAIALRMAFYASGLSMFMFY
ncbi:dimethyl sulfoxide reductase anchor subunit family protein [Adlercreutzia caecimuris]|uniref:dimethyl sulfoxide reductase anchor subunit family protein n=1 Tax=Adlercreutzia caecimuris TaxID=671266 RepID=UPI00249454F5|nr:DmsC/YnfH family molybdoenzyme membrane anchor subunit [Adlercreutzia caecimuris]